MIPRIIHLCWLSGDEFPPLIQSCIESWKEFLPDFEVLLWDTDRFDINSTVWTKECYSAKKYAFAADYIRLYALYNYGGIYLDSDVMVYKSFNDLLELPYFIGQDYTGSFEPAVIGAEKGMPWIGEILKHYDGRHFIDSQGKQDTTTLPVIFYNCLIDKYKFQHLNKKLNYKFDNNIFYLFDRDFFNSRNSIGVHQTNKSYCSHNYAGTWTDKKKGFKSFIKGLLPRWMIKIIYDVSHRTYKKSDIHQWDPVFMQKRIRS